MRNIYFILFAILLSFRTSDKNKTVNRTEYLNDMSITIVIKAILLTPSPDQRVTMLEPNNDLDKHSNLIKSWRQ